jgi:hypothetical protein
MKSGILIVFNANPGVKNKIKKLEQGEKTQK